MYHRSLNKETLKLTTTGEYPMTNYGNKTPTSPEQTLGVEKIVEICQRHQLREEAIEKVFEILSDWEVLDGNQEAKIQVGAYIAGPDPQREKILLALTKISMEFMCKRLGI